jgi:rhamnogalacturonyl hydrolase YesR
MREGYFELWADQGYMIPPFLAYLGLTTNNTELLEEALDQWLHTSAGLLDPSQNLYRHINTFDPRFWATGNGWMLAGLMRVLGSIKAAGGAGLGTKVRQAEETAALVFKALFDRLDASDRLPNYMGAHETDPKFTAGDSAGTTAVVGAFYRFLVMRPDLARPMKPAADRAFTAVVNKVNQEAWLTAVVDPQGSEGFLVHQDRDIRSPEGQSLLAIMWAARTAAGQ